MSTTGDDVDRLLISFKDAKVALMEWSNELHDLSSVSIHTYERAPQMVLCFSFKSWILSIDVPDLLPG